MPVVVVCQSLDGQRQLLRTVLAWGDGTAQASSDLVFGLDQERVLVNNPCDQSFD